jgi:uncharacterized membrane protein
MKNNFLRYLLAGLGYLLPIGLLVFILYTVFTYIDKLARHLIPDNWEFPGVAFVILILLLALFGWFTTVSKLDDYAKKALLGLLNKIPMLKNIYSSLEDITSALVGNKKTFDKPVLVKLSKDSDTERIGFIAKENLSALGIPKGKIAVALPFTFSYMSKIIIVPIENVTPIDAKASEVMKFVVSGGITEEHNAPNNNVDELLD